MNVLAALVLGVCILAAAIEVAEAIKDFTYHYRSKR